MINWTELVKVALLGTERAASVDFAAHSHLSPLLAALETANPAERLLISAAALDLYERAGRAPGVADERDHPNEPPLDKRPVCNTTATLCLGTMVQGQYRELLSEFLETLSHSGKRLPQEHLPNLLHMGSTAHTVRQSLLPVLGPRGRWLAAQNAKWSYAAPQTESWDGLRALWQSDNPKLRHALLQQLRHVDPDRGRQLLESTWKSEKDQTRAWFIKAIESGLSLDDEPFLEMALDDRNYTVRQRSVEYLARLPDSRLCMRMVDNCGSVLKWSPANASGIIVRFPAVINRAMVRDGIRQYASQNLSRVRSSQLTQMVGAIPLEHWTTTWGVTAEEVIVASESSRWPRTLSRAFSLAARRQRNRAWAQALLEQGTFGPAVIRLVAVLDPVQFEALVMRLDEQMPLAQRLHPDQPLVMCLRNWRQTWSQNVVAIWLARMRDHMQHEQEASAPNPILRTTLKQFARLCPVEASDEAATLLSGAVGPKSVWHSPIQETAEILRFRRNMVTALREQVPTGSGQIDGEER